MRNPSLTRQTLLDTAYDEIRKKGFQATNIQDILTRTQLSKGTLYHHFPSKEVLGYAVIDELVKNEIYQHWIAPLETATHPLAALRDTVVQAAACVSETRYGCPLATLSQELANKDEAFRLRLKRIYEQWRHGIAKALRRAKDQGEMVADVDPDATAAFIVAAIEGALSIAKVTRSAASLHTPARGLVAYLDTLSCNPQNRLGKTVTPLAKKRAVTRKLSKV